MRAHGVATFLALALAAGCTCVNRAVPAGATGSAGGSSGGVSTGAGGTSTGPLPDLPGDCHPEKYGECDPWCQDCPEGQKCTSWKEVTSNYWEPTRCVPVVDDPKGVGEPCTAFGGVSSGIDDCEKGAFCWVYFFDTLEGWCRPLCTGSEENPECPVQYRCGIADGVMNLCYPWCVPWPFPWWEGGEPCGPPDTACHPVPNVPDPTWEFPLSPVEWGLWCVLDASFSDVTQGVSCNGFSNYCHDGFTCVPSNLVPCNDPEADSCCTAWCDLAAPDCPDGTACKPVFQDGFDLDPVFDNLGLCLGI